MTRKTRKTTLLLVFALTLIALLGSFSTAGASGSLVADGLTQLPQVTASTESDEPKIEDVEPDQGELGQTLNVAIIGKNTHFDATSEVSFSPSGGITVSFPTVDNATFMTVTIAIAADAPVGKRDVTVTTVITAGVTEVVTKEHGFEVEAADVPEIEDIEPDEGKPGQTLDVAITGKNTHFVDASAFTETPTDISAAAFAPSSVATGTAVSFSPPDGITVNSTTVHNATSLTVNITIGADAPAGKRDVTVTTVISDGVTEVVTKEHGFKVKEADDPEEVEFKGIITSISPGTDPVTGTITVETGDDAVSLSPVTPITWTVHINADTRIRIGHEQEEGTIADLAVGQRVEVEGILQNDGSVLARKIHVKQNDDEQVGFRGTIIAKSDEVAVTPLPTLTVQMGSRTLTVLTEEHTEIRDADGNTITFDELRVGQEIKGKGILQEGGSILASEIEVVEDPGHERVRFEGVITGLPDGGLVGEWTVRTTAAMTITFSVDVNTKIKPPGVRPEMGDWAEVTAVHQEDGALLALKVHLRNGDHPRPVEFRGTIVEMEGNPPTKIVVNVRGHNEYADVATALVDVLIDDLTRIEGELMVDAHVKVEGFLLDNRSVLAKLIKVKYPEVEFRGRIESIEDGVWIVSGVTVLITDTTTITGATPQVGLLAEVKGILVRPRTVRATKIEVKDPSMEPVKIRGIIKTLPVTGEIIGTWTITTEDDNDVSIGVTADTVIDTEHGDVEEGALVRVTALLQDDGTLVAQRIKVFESD